MAWIESHQELGRHPKAIKLARLLGISIPQAVGHLHLLWWWAFDYAKDGELSRYDPEDIADAVLWEGSASDLVDALVRAGFLDQPDGRLLIHDWEQYGGKLLSRRRADVERKESQRNSNGIPADVQRNSSGIPAEQHRTSNGVPAEEDRSSDVDKKRRDKKRVSSRAGAREEEDDDDDDDDFVEDEVPLPVREIRDTVLSKLPQRYQRDPLTIDEALDFARDYAGQHLEVAEAIRACRRENELPFPGNLRKRLRQPAAVESPQPREPPPPTVEQLEAWLRERPERELRDPGEEALLEEMKRTRPEAYEAEMERRRRGRERAALT